MPPIRRANHLCPVCLKPYNSHFWLDKHIDDAHPRYHVQLETNELPKPRPNPLPVSTVSVTKGYAEDPRCNPSTDASCGFHANYDEVDDPAGLLPLASSGPGDDTLIATGEPYFDARPVTERYPEAGRAVPYVPTPEDHHDSIRHLNFVVDPLYPFESEEEYNFAELVTLQGLSAGVIDNMLKGNYGLKDSLCSSLKSNYHLRQKIDRMEDGLGHGSWKKSKLSMAWNDQHPDNIPFWHRDVIECAKWLLRQPAYEDHLTYAPIRSFNDAGQRVYDEMHTGEWWWEKQVVFNPFPCITNLCSQLHRLSFRMGRRSYPSSLCRMGRISRTFAVIRGMANIYDNRKSICGSAHET